MANKHIKVINGRKYYYESIRVGKKVTSRYLGPVERIRKKKEMKALQQIEQQMDSQKDQMQEESGLPSDESYIG